MAVVAQGGVLLVLNCLLVLMPCGRYKLAVTDCNGQAVERCRRAQSPAPAPALQPPNCNTFGCSAWSRCCRPPHPQSPSFPTYEAVHWAPPSPYQFLHARPRRPLSMRIYEAHVGMSSEEGKVRGGTGIAQHVHTRSHTHTHTHTHTRAHTHTHRHTHTDRQTHTQTQTQTQTQTHRHTHRHRHRHTHRYRQTRARTPKRRRKPRSQLQEQ